MKNSVTLKQNHEFRRAYHKGKSHATKILVLYCRKNRMKQNRYGITVGVKLGNAVRRNRVKRKIREAYRLHEDKLPIGYDFVLVARVRAVHASFSEIENALLQALAALHLLEAKQ